MRDAVFSLGCLTAIVSLCAAALYGPILLAGVLFGIFLVVRSHAKLGDQRAGEARAIRLRTFGVRLTLVVVVAVLSTYWWLALTGSVLAERGFKLALVALGAVIPFLVVLGVANLVQSRLRRSQPGGSAT